MALYHFYNGRQGSWTLILKNRKFNLLPGESREIECTQKEAASAEYPGIEITKASDRAAQSDAEALKAAEQRAIEAAKVERADLMKRAEPLEIADTDAMDNAALKAAVEKAEADAKAKADAEAKAKADAEAAEKAKAANNTGGGK